MCVCMCLSYRVLHRQSLHLRHWRRPGGGNGRWARDGRDGRRHRLAVRATRCVASSGLLHLAAPGCTVVSRRRARSCLWCHRRCRMSCSCTVSCLSSHGWCGRCAALAATCAAAAGAGRWHGMVVWRLGVLGAGCRAHDTSAGCVGCPGNLALQRHTQHMSDPGSITSCELE